ncbi:MAG: agmatinase [Planctomycetes bacterium]|nr:agmatinase [Planctomycetota bacterium]
MAKRAAPKGARKGARSVSERKKNTAKTPDIRSLVVKGDDNFFGLEPELATFDRARFVVMSAPFEGTVSYGKGTGAGPAAIKRASQQVELFDEITRAEHIPRHGVCTLKPFNPKCSAEQMTMGHVYGAARQIVAAGKFPILVGGEHSVTPGAIKACAEAYPDLSVLHIDAHSDLREAYHDDAFSHASAAARFNEWCPVVQIGIRSRERMETGKPGKPVWCYHAFDYRQSGPWIDEAISHLSRNVYLTIDVDGFDPSVFPGTGTPEPGGLSWYTGLDIIERLCKSRNVVGFDVVEVAPTKGTQVSEFAGARLMGRTMAFISHYCWRAEAV